MVAAVAGLVAQRPDDDAGMVAIALYHARNTLAHSRQPERIVGKPVHRLHAVGFNIGFVDHVQPIAVAQSVPKRVVWVV
ncbi:hypothetical protein D3C87_1907350 [compost metagenome]